MGVIFDDSYPEPSAGVGFAGDIIVSASESRDNATMAAAFAHPGRRFHLFCDGKVLVLKGDRPTATFGQATAAKFDADLGAAILLGTVGEGPRLAARFKTQSGSVDEPYHLYDMRALLYSSSVSDAEAGACSRASSLMSWHSANRFCGRCGKPSVNALGGYRLDCSSCEHKIFPRTDPAVIMLAVRGDHCLLGRGPHFPPGWFSTLAGFVEPGETIEAAVRRETKEESGIEIRRVRYHASQPWPFPHSLMIGAYGEAVSEVIRFDRNELEDCRWFSREEVQLMIADRHPDGVKCPPTKAIAHALIRNWAVT